MPRGELKINAGVHWGGALYLGQVITGGRLEVTALGDEVNECARIQQSARDGALLASKPLVERLDPEHAQAFGLDPLTIMYRTVGELPGVTPKAVRDAGRHPRRDRPASGRQVEREVVEARGAVAREQADPRRAAGIDALAVGHVAERRRVDRVDQRQRLARLRRCRSRAAAATACRGRCARSGSGGAA